jgi:hypothetical protein
MLVSARFEFESVVYCNLYSFLSFIYLLMVTFGSFALGRLFNFISAGFWFNGALYFSLTNLSCRKKILN